MSQETKTIALLTENPALAAILSSVLAEHRELRVRSFETLDALKNYVGISGIDMLVCDYAVDGGLADRFIPDLRNVPGNDNPMFRAITLTRQVPPHMRSACAVAGIDEVIVKPMSPRYVEERVMARLARPLSGAFERPKRTRDIPEFPTELYGDNVVPLFPRNPSPNGPR